jgi:hypothetical protein
LESFVVSDRNGTLPNPFARCRAGDADSAA